MTNKVIDYSQDIIADGVTKTFAVDQCGQYNSLIIACKTDQDGILYADFSIDGVTWGDSTLTYQITGNINEVHKLTITRNYFRIRFENNSGSDQTYFRMQSILGEQTQLTAPLNLGIQQDADSIVVRSIDSEIDIANGKYTGYSITNKFGKNSDVDTGTVPEDVWETGGVYTGWATVAETVQVFSSSANDTAAGTGARTIRIIGLDSNYDVISETVTLNGTTPIVTTNTFIRVHTASTQTAGSGGVNAGLITFRQSTTTANVFLTMLAGNNQTNCSAYTIPAGHTGYLKNLTCSVGTNSNVSAEGGIWTRSFGGVFRRRRPFNGSDNYRVIDEIYGGLSFSEKSDLIIRITSCTTNNTPISAGYDLLIIKD